VDRARGDLRRPSQHRYLNFGHSAFFGIGAYTTAILMVRTGGTAPRRRWRSGGGTKLRRRLPDAAAAGAYFATPRGRSPGPSSSLS
jgi:ABC-type branched-subunit amino acid transport system permease subunit